MPAESLAPGLESYQIGPRIHALRKSKNLSLVKLGEHTGMSAGLLSKIERGRLIRSGHAGSSTTEELRDGLAFRFWH